MINWLRRIFKRREVMPIRDISEVITNVTPPSTPFLATRPANHKRRFSEDEVEAMTFLFTHATSHAGERDYAMVIQQLGKLMGRTPKGIYSKLYDLGLKPHWDTKTMGPY